MCTIIQPICFEDDFKTQVLSAKKQLQEAQELQNKVDAKLNTALQNVRAVQDEKGTLEAKLGQKQAILQAQVRKQRILAHSVKKSPPFKFPNQKLVYISVISSSCTTCSGHLICFYLITLYMVKSNKLLNFPLCSFLLLPVSSSLRPNILFSTLSACASLGVRDQVSHPYTTCNITLLYIK